MAAIDDEIVALGLAVDRLADRRLEGFIAFRLTQGRAQIRRILLAEAHIQSTGAGHPNAVAALAKIMGQGCDKPEAPTGFAHHDIARRATGAVIGLVESPAPLQPGPHQ